MKTQIEGCRETEGYKDLNGREEAGSHRLLASEITQTHERWAVFMEHL